MRLATVRERLSLIDERGAVDVENASNGLFSADAQAVFERWAEFGAWVAQEGDQINAAPAAAYDESHLSAPVPSPRQIFGIGLNYREHAAESGLALPEGQPVVFAKFASSIAGPGAVVELPSQAVDYETELVVVIGSRAHRVVREAAWSYVAGLTLGQDLSEREVQFRGPTPQFSLGKSYPGFSQIGPVLVTLEEFGDPEDIGLGCTLNGEKMQQGRTNDLVFSIPELIESLSAIVPLLPGDLIFTGTPAGIGWARDPRVVLKPGDTLITQAEVIGEMTTNFTTA